ncbi:hypothetical protein [Flexibacterium corallicola]|uniref:hypothetical protein n=1 Tax=Flexibacterium corallicola TaxID=3037259 RepID=UPI00286F44C9|nr:hypothetical protein [Pseudovibrio sp. M1P-2-3]
MTPINWPSSVPYAPLLDSIDVVQAYSPPVSTSFEAGNTRERHVTNMHFRKQKQTVPMSLAECEAFKAFFEGELYTGHRRFNMKVLLETDYFEKEVKINPASLSFKRIGRTVQVTMELTITL